MDKKNWIIAAVTVVASVLVAVLCGYFIQKMTVGKNPASASTSAQGESNTEPGSSEEAPVDRPVVIKELSENEISSIKERFSGEGKIFYTNGSADEKTNKPHSMLSIWNSLHQNVSNRIHVFQSDEATVGIIFLLTSEIGSNTDYVLDELKVNGAKKATFFVTKNYVVNNPETIKTMVHDGHKLGVLLTSSDETQFVDMTPEEQMAQALEITNELKNYGADTPFCAFNDFKYSEQAFALMTEMGYTLVMPTVSYEDDSVSAQLNANEFLAEMETRLHKGAVYQFHTVNSASLLVMSALLGSVTDAGYEVAPLN